MMIGARLNKLYTQSANVRFLFTLLEIICYPFQGLLYNLGLTTILSVVIAFCFVEGLIESILG